MKKVYIYILSILSAVFLAGCTVKNNFKYEFDGFYGLFETEKTFELNKEKLQGLGYKLINNSIVKIYSAKNTTGFTDSIIITQKESDKSLDLFIKENLNNVKINGLKSNKSRTYKLQCPNQKSQIITYKFKYATNQYDVCLAQGFTKLGPKIYIISYSTLDQKDCDSFIDSLKNISCK